MVVAEESSSLTQKIPYPEEKDLKQRPRLACDEFERLMKIVQRKGLKVSESDLLVAAYTGCDIFFKE